jgi:hypothetical protein
MADAARPDSQYPVEQRFNRIPRIRVVLGQIAFLGVFVRDGWAQPLRPQLHRSSLAISYHWPELHARLGRTTRCPLPRAGERSRASIARA